MQIGRAHIIRDRTLRQLEERIVELTRSQEPGAGSGLHLVDASGERRPVPTEPTGIELIEQQLQRLRGEHERELIRLRDEHEHEFLRIGREHRVRMAHSVAEAEAAARRLQAPRSGASAWRARLLTDPTQVPRATPPATPIFLPESATAHRLLDGLEGLEIGPGAHSPFGLKTRSVGLTAEMDAVDFEFCKQYQIGFCGTWAPIDIGGDAENIPVPDSSTDFVIHAHVWEHLANPLKGLDEWVRVVRAGGYILAIVPKRDTVPADACLPVTPLWEHVLHYLLDTDYAGRVSPECLGREHHVSRFTLESLREIGAWFNWYHQGKRLEEAAALETDDKAGNGHLIAWQLHKPA